MKLRKVYYFQDGAQFFLFYQETAPNLSEDRPDACIEYPGHISDGAIEKAVQANNWFCSTYCVQNNLNPVRIIE